MNKILSSEITAYSSYINRRKFIKSTTAISIVSSLSFASNASHNSDSLQYNDKLDEGDELNTFEEITTYNNFYYFLYTFSFSTNSSTKNAWSGNARITAT